MNASTRLLRFGAIALTALATGPLLALDVSSTHQVHLDARVTQTTQTVTKELLERVPGPRGNNLEWLRAVGPAPLSDVSKLGTGTTIRGLESGSGTRIVIDGIQFNFTPKVAENGTSIGINILPMSAVEQIQVAPYRSTVTVPTNSSLLIGYQPPNIQDGPNKFLIITPTISQSPSSPSTQVITAPGSYSKWELGAFYNYMQSDEYETEGEHVQVKGLHGYSITGYYNFNRFIAAGVQFGGYYGTTTISDFGFKEEMFLDRYSFMGGLRLQCGSEGPVRPFGQFFMGAVHDRIGVDFAGNYYSTSDTAFAMSLGGGVNFEVTDHLTIVPSVDWFPTFFSGSDQQNNWRIGIGVNWRF